MVARFESIASRRAIIDRRQLADALAALEGDPATLKREATALLKRALDDGRAEIARRLAEHPSRGIETAASYAFLTDQILRLIFDFAAERLLPRTNRTAGERLTLMAVGGYGRAEMALYSDVDIGFLTPWKQTAWAEQVIETILYMLWDLGLKVGHSSRSLDEMVQDGEVRSHHPHRVARRRASCGATRRSTTRRKHRFEREVMDGTARAFVTEKLAERDDRHHRMGDSRYVVEPNLKEGKGGLRDLHTLFWIGKYVLQVRSVPELVGAGLLTADELKQFQRAENFLWAVRCHLHIVAGRAEERLTFDLQREIATRMRYQRPAGALDGRALHAALFPHRENGGHADRAVPRPSRRDLRAQGQPLRACRCWAAGANRASSKASSSIAAG